MQINTNLSCKVKKPSLGWNWYKIKCYLPDSKQCLKKKKTLRYQLDKNLDY